MAIFPPALPALQGMADFAAVEAENVIRTQMDAGPPKTRRRSTAGPLRWKMGHPAYTTAELATFLRWFRVDAAHGSLSFDMTDPVFGGTKSFRFAAPPQWSPSGPDRYAVSVDLEVLP